MTIPDDAQPVAVPAGEDPDQAPTSPFASPSGRRELPPTPPTPAPPTPDARRRATRRRVDAAVAPPSAAAAETARRRAAAARAAPAGDPLVGAARLRADVRPAVAVRPANPYGPAVQQPVPAPWAGVPYTTTGTTAGVDPVPPPGPSGVPHTVVLHRKRRRTLSAAWVVPLVVIALAAGAVGGVAGLPAHRRTTTSRTPACPSRPPVPAPVERAPDSVAGIAAGVLPSVVSIQVDGPDGSATGSGFVLRGDGYLVTNNHVIAQADGAASTTITVTFVDGSEQDATIVGRTADYDLAVLKVDVEGLTPLLLGDSDAVVVGDPVVAVGAPLGLAGTVTTGIVSALNRPVSAGEADRLGRPGVHQRDPDGRRDQPRQLRRPAGQRGRRGHRDQLGDRAAAGLAVDGRGQHRPRVRHPLEPGAPHGGPAHRDRAARRTRSSACCWTSGTPARACRSRRTTQDGRQPVTADGPAERAGIHPGDVILAIDGRPVTDPDELIVAIRARTPGDTIVLHVRSGSSERDVRVKLDESPTD